MMYRISWQTLSKRFAIRVALPHLLVGVMAAAFSLSNQNALPANPSSQTNIVTIASVMVNLQELQSDINTQTQYIKQNVQILVKDSSALPPIYIEPTQVIRLTPNNGIRAGPSSLFV